MSEALDHDSIPRQCGTSKTGRHVIRFFGAVLGFTLTGVLLFAIHKAVYIHNPWVLATDEGDQLEHFQSFHDPILAVFRPMSQYYKSNVGEKNWSLLIVSLMGFDALTLLSNVISVTQGGTFLATRLAIFSALVLFSAITTVLPPPAFSNLPMADYLHTGAPIEVFIGYRVLHWLDVSERNPGAFVSLIGISALWTSAVTIFARPTYTLGILLAVIFASIAHVVPTVRVRWNWYSARYAGEGPAPEPDVRESNASRPTPVRLMVDEDETVAELP